MVDVRMRHRADDCELIGALRELRKMLADLDAGNLRGDRTKLAANLGRGIRFHVPRILMGRTSPHEEQDARLGAPESRSLSFNRIASRQELIHRQAEQAQTASAQDRPAI